LIQLLTVNSPRWHVGCCHAPIRVLVGSQMTLAPVIIPLMGLPLHRKILCWALIAGLGIHAELLV
jgi:hypothetical protein